MSYILDAIKKSDQQRDLGTTPDVHTIHEPPLTEPPRRPGWLYGLATILLLNAGVIGWWLWPGITAKPTIAKNPDPSAVAQALQKKKLTPSPLPQQVAIPPEPTIVNPPAVQAAAAPPPSVSSVPTSPPPVDSSVVVPGDSSPAAATAIIPTPSPVSSQTALPPTLVNPAHQSIPPPPPAQPKAEPAPPPAMQAASPQTPASKPQIMPPSTATDKAKPVAANGKENLPPMKVANPATKPPPVAVVPIQTPSPPDGSQEEPLAAEEPSPEADETGGTGATATDQTLSPIAASAATKSKSKKIDKESEDPELAKIPLLNQLPLEVQQGIPELHISFHSYSIKPSARLVSISGKILREGEAFDETIKLETITTQGVVLAIKERRFRLRVNPSSRL